LAFQTTDLIRLKLNLLAVDIPVTRHYVELHYAVFLSPRKIECRSLQAHSADCMCYRSIAGMKGASCEHDSLRLQC